MKRLHDGRATAGTPIAAACYVSRRPHWAADRPSCALSWRAGTAFVLGQRIEAALRRPARLVRTPTAACFGVIAIALLTALSAVIAVPVHDRRLSRTDAEQLVAATPGSAAWGLTVNDAVLEQLNLLLGTPDGRAFVSSSIERMHDYEPGLLTELKSHGLPPELLMVPLVESGYRNLAARRGRARVCGCSSARPPAITDWRSPRTGMSAWTLRRRRGQRCTCFRTCGANSRIGRWYLMAYNSGIITGRGRNECDAHARCVDALSRGLWERSRLSRADHGRDADPRPSATT